MKIETRIQKWGNGLAVRIAGIMRDVPHFENGTPIEVEVSEDGLQIRKLRVSKPLFPFSEAELLANISQHTSHADLLAKPMDGEF